MSNKALQLPSQFHRYGNLGQGHVPHMHLIAHIFFPTDDAILDTDDRGVLDALVDTYGPSLRRPPILKFVGYADYRSTDEHNYKLALRRAHAVQAYVAMKLQGKGHRLVEVSSESRGEREPAHKGLAYDRRVDVYSSFVNRRPPHVFDAVVIEGQYTGPLSNKFRFRTLAGGSLGKVGVAVQKFYIEIQNVRTGYIQTYTYEGWGIGAGFQINRATDWSEKSLPDGLWLDVADFEGPGRAHSIGIIYTGVAFVFEGPMKRGKATQPLIVSFEGWDIYGGLEKDISGYWSRVQLDGVLFPPRRPITLP